MGHPQWIYHRVEEPMIIDSGDLEGYIALGWATTPAAFSQGKRERELRKRLSALEKEALEVMDEINRIRAAGRIEDDPPRKRRKRT